MIDKNKQYNTDNGYTVTVDADEPGWVDVKTNYDTHRFGRMPVRLVFSHDDLKEMLKMMEGVS